jgi:hypothetical protein
MGTKGITDETQLIGVDGHFGVWRTSTTDSSLGHFALLDGRERRKTNGDHGIKIRTEMRQNIERSDSMRPTVTIGSGHYALDVLEDAFCMSFAPDFCTESV